MRLAKLNCVFDFACSKKKNNNNNDQLWSQQNFTSSSQCPLKAATFCPHPHPHIDAIVPHSQEIKGWECIFCVCVTCLQSGGVQLQMLSCSIECKDTPYIFGITLFSFCVYLSHQPEKMLRGSSNS